MPVEFTRREMSITRSAVRDWAEGRFRDLPERIAEDASADLAFALEEIDDIVLARALADRLDKAVPDAG